MTDGEVIETGPLPGQPAGPANPAQLVVAGVQRCLALAASWQAWDGQPIILNPGGPAHTWTPHKALRRIADHLLDHLHEVEALLAGADAMPDHWHGRAVTLGTDLAPVTGPDLDEARSRLARLATATCFAMPPPGLPPGMRPEARPGHCAKSRSTSLTSATTLRR